MHNNLPMLEYVKLKIGVCDLGHFLGTVANLADVRSQIRAERFELEITRDSAAGATLDQLTALGARIQKTTDEVKVADSTVVAATPPAK